MGPHTLKALNGKRHAIEGGEGYKEGGEEEKELRKNGKTGKLPFAYVPLDTTKNRGSPLRGEN